MIPDSSLPDTDWEEGAALLLRAQGGDPVHAEALRAWIGHDRLRNEAIKRVQQAWSSFAHAGDHPALQAARRSALDVLDAHARWKGRRRLMLAAASAALLLLPAGLWLSRTESAHPSVIANATDTVRTVRLADGSIVALDRLARLEVLFSGSERKVTLRRGQARFEVAHDAGRPFHVIANGRDVRALGTNFNVDMQDGRLEISLIRGRVAVSRIQQHKGWIERFARETALQPVTLRPGQQLVVSNGGGMEVRSFQPEEVTAWQQGKLIISNRPLEQAVAAVNRYATPKILLDPDVAPGLRVSGAFSVRDGMVFADNLTILFPELTAHRDGKLVVISPSKGR